MAKAEEDAAAAKAKSAADAQAAAAEENIAKAKAAEQRARGRVAAKPTRWIFTQLRKFHCCNFSDGCFYLMRYLG